MIWESISMNNIKNMETIEDEYKLLADPENIKKKLEELSELYKKLADELLVKTYETKIVREQINYCLELLSIIEEEKTKE